MKKKIAFLMASIMTLSMMPAVNSYASSENKLSNGNITVSEKTMFYEAGVTKPALNTNQSKVKYLTEANYLNIKLEDDIATGASFGIELDNAKFAFDSANYVTGSVIDTRKGVISGSTYTRNFTGISAGNEVGYELTVDVDSYATVVTTVAAKSGQVIRIPLIARMDENMTSGTAKVSIRSGNSGLSSNSLVFATINKGSTNAYVENAQTGKNKISIEKIVIKENVAGSMNPGENEGFYLELPSGYTFSGTPVISFVNITGANAVPTFDNSNRKLNVRFSSFTPAKGIIGQIIITGLNIIPNSSSDTISTEEIKISIDNIGSSDMVTAQEFTAGTHADYNMNFKTDGTVPTVLNGFYDTTSTTNDRVKSVKVVVAEETAGSLINGGDLILTLSDSAKINAVKIEDKENISQAINGTYELGSTGNVEVKESRVTLRNIGNSSSSSSDKAKFTISFYLSIESGFVGDVTMKVSGDAIRNNTSVEPVVIAKAINPLTTPVSTNYIVPGQTIELGDMVLTEQMNSKGYSALEEGKTVMLGFNNNNNYLSIVGTPTIKTENGLTVKNVKTSSTNASGSALSFTIDEASSRNKASKITISGLKVAASASTPQGTYALVAGGSAIAGNSTTLIGSDKKASFATDGMLISKLQYGGKVAMKITIGDRVVNVNGQNVEMKIAPFIDAKTGTTYMQVSDIVKATGKTCTFFDNRIQKIEGMDKNLFVTFGNRTFEKDKSVVKIAGQTIPETMTNEQGTAVNMIIKDDYTCLPLRYFVEKVLGQRINWNGTDSTITVE